MRWEVGRGQAAWTRVQLGDDMMCVINQNALESGRGGFINYMGHRDNRYKLGLCGENRGVHSF